MGGESDMWEAVKRVNAIADKKFVKREYEVLNGFLHDLANSRLSTEEIINAAKTFFWFGDDDFAQPNEKVWWYYSNK